MIRKAFGSLDNLWYLTSRIRIGVLVSSHVTVGFWYILVSESLSCISYPYCENWHIRSCFILLYLVCIASQGGRIAL